MFPQNLPDTFFGEFDGTPEGLQQAVEQTGLTPFSYLEDGGPSAAPYAYKVEPTRAEAGQASSLGTAEIPWHTDNSCLIYENRPDYLFLGCVNNPGQTKFAIADLHKVVRALPPWAFEQLSSPVYTFKIPHSFSRHGWQGEIVGQPLIKGCLSQPEGAFNLGLTVSILRAKLAESSLNAWLDHFAHAVILQPGQYLGFNNRRYAHRRGKPTGDRLLWRIYAQRDLETLTLRRIQNNQFSVKS